jgi:5-hydroxyisourate hydrolase
VTLSTHVLDATMGRPAAGVAVRLDRRTADGWVLVGEGVTGADGRLAGWLPAGQPTRGVYRITFASGSYFAERGTASFYPEVTVAFEVSSAGEHYHVPLLLSPFAYSTYRGS